MGLQRRVRARLSLSWRDHELPSCLRRLAKNLKKSCSSPRRVASGVTVRKARTLVKGQRRKVEAYGLVMQMGQSLVSGAEPRLSFGVQNVKSSPMPTAVRFTL